MNELAMGVNFPAVLLGTVLAFLAGWLWYGPLLFRRVWSEGSHGIAPPGRIPAGPMAAQLTGTFLMAWLVGITARSDALATAFLVILAIAVLIFAGGLMSQKSGEAALVDGGYAVVMGALMIAAQGVL